MTIQAHGSTFRDPAQPTSGADAPCNIEGCMAGMLIMKFVGKATGFETIVPVEKKAVFSAPEDGEVSYRINDTSFYDNKWHRSGSVIDHRHRDQSCAMSGFVRKLGFSLFRWLSSAVRPSWVCGNRAGPR